MIKLYDFSDFSLKFLQKDGEYGTIPKDKYIGIWALVCPAVKIYDRIIKEDDALNKIVHDLIEYDSLTSLIEFKLRELGLEI